MRKIVIIINGNGTVGKDTLCGFAGERYKVTSISAITPIKNIARQYGWNGEKDSKSRKFLADLKKAFIEYNDLPFLFLTAEYEKFLHSDMCILFFFFRERDEINKFKNHVKIPCITLLIRRDNLSEKWGNDSDDQVENYTYDYIYHNNKSLSDAKDDFCTFVQTILTNTFNEEECC